MCLELELGAGAGKPSLFQNEIRPRNGLEVKHSKAETAARIRNN